MKPTKNQTFCLRLDDQDRMRLDVVSEHYSAPAATAVRILIKMEHDRILLERQRQARIGRSRTGEDWRGMERQARRGTAR